MTMKDYIFPGTERPYVNQAYIDALESVGTIPLLFPLLRNEADADVLLGTCDGLVLTGGFDVHPSFYGQDMREKMESTMAKLDRFQIAVCRRAVAGKIPFLGICRGLQILNVAVGGSLFQDVTEKEGRTLKHFQAGGDRSDAAHAILIEPGSRLASIFPAREIMVNSLHHQSADRLGDGLVATARSGDGHVEALELRDHPFGLSVQWHPELMMDGDRPMLPLFEAFAEACRSKGA